MPEGPWTTSRCRGGPGSGECLALAAGPGGRVPLRESERPRVIRRAAPPAGRGLLEAMKAGRLLRDDGQRVQFWRVAHSRRVVEPVLTTAGSGSGAGGASGGGGM